MYVLNFKKLSERKTRFILFLLFLTQYMYKLGMSKAWMFTDVFGLDPDLLAMLPQPVVALILLFPETENVSQEKQVLAKKY